MEYPEILLTKQELAERLQVTTKTIENWRAEGMPCFRLSPKVVRYEYQAAMKWLTERNQQTTEGAQ